MIAIWRRIGLLAAALAAPAVAQETLIVPYTYDIGSFDPADAFEVLGLSAIDDVYEGLVEYAPGSTEIRGLLATSWEVSEDGLTHRFELVDGATFHDGTPRDAEAVIRSFERRRDGEMILGYFLPGVTGMEAPDPGTLVLTLGAAQPSFLDRLASPWGPKVVSPTALDAHPKAWFAENAVGTGPFRLARFARGQDYLLERFEDYHGEAPFFAAVEIPIVPDTGQQILQLRAQEIDAVPTNYPWDQLAALPPGIVATAQDSMALVMAFVNPASPLAEPALHDAVLAAIEPSLWVQDAFGGHAEPALSIYHAVMLEPSAPLAFPTDMGAARAAVEAAGPVALSIGYGVEETQNVDRVAELLAAQLAGIGVEATVEPLPSGAIFSLREDLEGAPDLVLSRLNPDAAHPELQAAVFYQTGAVLNLMGASLPEADAIAAEAAAMTDPEARDAAYEEAGHLWFDAGHFVPLADVQDVVVHAEGLTDLGLRPVFPPGNIDFGTVRWE